MNLEGRQFIGAEVLQRKSEGTQLAARVGLMLDGRRVAREGAKLFDNDSRRIGQVTSGTFSPTFEKPIAMAYVSPAMAVVGTSVDVDIRGSRVAGKIVALPFYKRNS